MKPDYARERSTSSTHRRINNLRKIIEALKASGGMTTDQVCELIDMSPSGGRKYIRDLRHGGAVMLTNHVDARPPHFIGFAVFSLVSEEAAEKFLAEIALPPVKNGKPKAPAELPQLPGHRTHIMRDDMRFEMPRCKVICRRDDLVAALFGPAQAVA